MTLEILIIEDDPKHLEDAKQETQRRIDAKEPIKVDYAATFKEAEDLMEKKRYDGIITDIFFPYDDTKRENGPDGWSGIARMECANALEKAKAWPVYPERIPGIVDAFTMWLEGKEMHPTGLMITEKALEEQIPVIDDALLMTVKEELATTLDMYRKAFGERDLIAMSDDAGANMKRALLERIENLMDQVDHEIASRLPY